MKMAGDPIDYSDAHRLFEMLFGPKLAKQYTDAYMTRPSSFREVVFGQIGPIIWHRDGLDFRTKLVAMVVIFATTGQAPQFKSFARAALINGISQAEIEELMLLVGLETGMPRAADAIDWLAEAAEQQAAFEAQEGAD